MHTPTLRTTRAVTQTTWAKEFKVDSPASYSEAVELAVAADLVVDIERATTVMGDACFAILVADRTPAFWMDHKPSRKAAEALCIEMGWRVRR